MGTINTEQLGTVRIVRLAGRFATDDDLALLRTAIPICVTPAVRCVVVNWSAVEEIGSAGVGAITGSQTEFSQSGGHYRNCDFSEYMDDLTQVLKMGYEWEWNYFQTEEEAIRACAENPSGGIAESGAQPSA